MGMPLTIIIPARHEEKIVTRMLDDLETHVKTPHRIIVVNDSDPADLTAGVVLHYIKNRPNIRLIHRFAYPKPTFATALALGFKAATRGVVLPVMADRCDDAKSIDKMYQKLLQGGDIVCGSRYMSGGRKIGGPIIQSLFSKFVCLSLKSITGVPTHDISNSFKMYKTSILEDIPIDKTSGVEISMKITLTAYFTGAKITEVPTTWMARTANESKFNLVERVPRYVYIYLWALCRRLGLRKS